MESLTKDSRKWVRRALRYIKDGNLLMAAACFQKAGDLFKEMNNAERAEIFWGKAATAFLEKANDEIKHKRFEDAAKSFEKAGRVFHHKLDNADAAANCYMRATQCRVRTANRQFRSAVAD